MNRLLADSLGFLYPDPFPLEIVV